MSENQSEVIGPQLNYKVVNEHNPKYRFLRLSMSNKTGTSFTITSTTSDLIEFKLPTHAVYNLAQSYIGYEISVPAQGANTNVWFHEDCADIAQTVYFGNNAGLDVCNLNFANRYTKIARKLKTSISDFLSNDNSSQLYPCNSLGASNYHPATAVGTTNYIESKYMSVGFINTASTAARFYPLSGFKDTILATDKDVFFPNDMYLRITTPNGNQICYFNTSSATDPTAGTPTAVAGNITIQNVFLYLAVEVNDLVKHSVMNLVATKGLSLSVPYVTSFRNSTTGTVGNIQLQLTQQFGKRLKRIMHTVWHGTETLNTAMDCTNLNQGKIVTYNTYLDNQQLQDLLISTSTATKPIQDDWRENAKYCDNTCIYNKLIYQTNFFHIDQFYEENKKTNVPEDNLQDGLPMNATRLWQIQSTTSNATWIHYTFAVFGRSLLINSQGAIFEQ